MCVSGFSKAETTLEIVSWWSELSTANHHSKNLFYSRRTEPIFKIVFIWQAKVVHSVRKSAQCSSWWLHQLEEYVFLFCYRRKPVGYWLEVGFQFRVSFKSFVGKNNILPCFSPSAAGIPNVNFFTKAFLSSVRGIKKQTYKQDLTDRYKRLGEAHKVWIKDQIPSHNRTRAIGWYSPYKSPATLWSDTEERAVCALDLWLTVSLLFYPRLPIPHASPTSWISIEIAVDPFSTFTFRKNQESNGLAGIQTGHTINLINIYFLPSRHLHLHK